MVTIYTTSLTFHNSTFCPHSVFMYFVWISEQTAIISLYSVNWLVCITKTECLLRGTDWMFIHNSGWRLLTAVSCLRQLRACILPRNSGFDSRPVHVRSVVHKVVLGQVATRELSPCSHHQYITPPVLHAHFHLKAALTRKTRHRYYIGWAMNLLPGSFNWRHNLSALWLVNRASLDQLAEWWLVITASLVQSAWWRSVTSASLVQSAGWWPEPLEKMPDIERQFLSLPAPGLVTVLTELSGLLAA